MPSHLRTEERFPYDVHDTAINESRPATLTDLFRQWLFVHRP
jgi:hypothetical protein